MKKLFILASMLLAGLSTQAQSTPENGDLQLNAGLGFSSWGLPIYVGLDYGIGHDITIGGMVSYTSDSETIHSEKYKHSAIGISVNGNYHFNRIFGLPSEFDVYAGLSIGYYKWTHSVGNSSVTYSRNGYDPFNPSLQIGGRYFFNQQWAANLQLNTGKNSGTLLGVTYKF